MEGKYYLSFFNRLFIGSLNLNARWHAIKPCNCRRPIFSTRQDPLLILGDLAHGNLDLVLHVLSFLELLRGIIPLHVTPYIYIQYCHLWVQCQTHLGRIFLHHTTWISHTSLSVHPLCPLSICCLSLITISDDVSIHNMLHHISDQDFQALRAAWWAPFYLYCNFLWRDNSNLRGLYWDWADGIPKRTER